MKKRLLLFISMLTVTVCVHAQEQPDKKQMADRHFERYEYAKAVNLYLDLSDRNKPDVKVIERLADCYRLMGDQKNAEQWYASATAYDKAAPIAFYYYAEALLHNNQPEKARVQYRAYYAKTKDSNGLGKKLATCDSAQKWMAAPAPHKVKNEQKLNSIYSEWGMCGYGKAGYVFTSNRPVGYEVDSKTTDPRTGNGYFKLYRANADSVVAIPLNTEGNTIFNGDYHAGPVAFNSAADTAWFTITTTLPKGMIPKDKREKGTQQALYTRRLQLILATKTAAGWGNFKSFAWNNIKEYSLGHAALTRDGNLLYFTSDMPGGEGKTDIWYSAKQADGTWGKPVNCGKSVNTADEEAFPTIGGDGALYFSSKGLPGMGGYDIFKTTGSMVNWSQPVNLKYPLNSTADDFSMLTDSGQSGYLSSNRNGGSGSDDIYGFKQEPVIVVSKSLVPAKPAITLQSANLTPSKDDICAIIYYDLDKDVIRPDAAAELDKLALVLLAHPSWHAKLASYTDTRASSLYNIALSQCRAISAVNYLVAKGISRSRLTGVWYGKNDPVNECADDINCTEAQHQLNRRTEIYTFVP